MVGAYKTKTLFILAYSVLSFFGFICLFGFFFSISGRNIPLFSSLLAYSYTSKTDFSLSGSISACPVTVAYSVLQCKNTDVLIMFCATRNKNLLPFCSQFGHTQFCTIFVPKANRCFDNFYRFLQDFEHVLTLFVISAAFLLLKIRFRGVICGSPA